MTTYSNTALASRGLENKQLQLETTFAKSHNTMEIQGGRGGGGARVAGDAGRSAGALLGAFAETLCRSPANEDVLQVVATRCQPVKVNKGRRRSHIRFLPVKSCKSSSRRGAAACSPCFYRVYKTLRPAGFLQHFHSSGESSFCASAWLFNIPLLLLHPDFKRIIRLLTGLHIAALYSKAL